MTVTKWEEERPFSPNCQLPPRAFIDTTERDGVGWPGGGDVTAVLSSLAQITPRLTGKHLKRFQQLRHHLAQVAGCRTPQRPFPRQPFPQSRRLRSRLLIAGRVAAHQRQ